jgi:hypothetical protein
MFLVAGHARRMPLREDENWADFCIGRLFVNIGKIALKSNSSTKESLEERRRPDGEEHYTA